MKQSLIILFAGIVIGAVGLLFVQHLTAPVFVEVVERVETDTTETIDSSITQVVLHDSGVGAIEEIQTIPASGGEPIKEHIAKHYYKDFDTGFQAWLSYNIERNLWQNKYDFPMKEYFKLRNVTTKHYITRTETITKFPGTVLGLGAVFKKHDEGFRILPAVSLEKNFKWLMFWFSIEAETAFYFGNESVEFVPELKTKIIFNL